VLPEIAPPPAGPAGVWAVSRLVPRGQRITQADLVLLPIRENLPANAVTQLDAALGKIAISDLPPYSMLLSDRISGDIAKAGLALTIPPGYRAVALRTTDEIAVSNFIRPGDHVDVQVIMRENVLPKQTEAQERAEGNPSESRTLIQDVIVLTVGESLSGEDPASVAAQAGGKRPEPPRTVTLGLTPEQVAQFVLGRSLGGLFLSLRNPSDLQTVQVNTAKLPDIRGPVAPAAAPVEQGKRPIELITGNKSQTIYSTDPAGKR
jgi:pilus assembly protein CpaB